MICINLINWLHFTYWWRKCIGISEHASEQVLCFEHTGYMCIGELLSWCLGKQHFFQKVQDYTLEKIEKQSQEALDIISYILHLMRFVLQSLHL